MGEARFAVLRGQDPRSHDERGQDDEQKHSLGARIGGRERIV